jgi:TM2 domain-containing membrane protein YozV
MWLLFLGRFQYFAAILNPNQTVSMRKITIFILSLFVILTSTTAFVSVPENATDAVKAGITAPTSTAVVKTKTSKGKLFMKIFKNKLEKIAQKAKRAGDKSKVVAILLALFLGNLGIHDFYLGNKRNGFIKLGLYLVGLALYIIGLVSLATAETATLPALAIVGLIIILGLSIWSLVDLIRIITGKYEPVDGSYTD